MAKVITIAVPKGGTAKTTTTLNLGAALTERGQRVLLVDFDPQGNLSQALGVNPDEQEHNVYTALKHLLRTFEPRLSEMLLPTPVGFLASANALLNMANEELAVAMEREKALQKLLQPLHQQFDYILIDTLPYLGILTINALVAADEVLIPLQPEFLAAKSVALILDQIELMRRSGLNPRLSVTGVLLTMVDTRLNIHREAIEHAHRTLGAKVPIFRAVVRRSVRVPESQAYQQSILTYDPTGLVACAYRELAEEVLRGTQGIL